MQEEVYGKLPCLSLGDGKNTEKILSQTDKGRVDRVDDHMTNDLTRPC